MLLVFLICVQQPLVATAEGIYSAMNAKLEELLHCPNPLALCTSVVVDNTSVNIGVWDSIKTRVLSQNSEIYFNGCPNYIIHNAAQKAGESCVLVHYLLV